MTATPGQFHRPKPAPRPNAFEAAGAALFSKTELGREACKRTNMTPQGQAKVQANNERMSAIIDPDRTARQVSSLPAYSRAGPGPHHKGPRARKETP